MRKLFFLQICSLFCLLQIGIIQAQEDEQIVSPAQMYSATIQLQMEKEVFNYINQNRVANFLPALTWSEVVAEQARSHSLNMANKIVPFSHEGASQRFAALTKSIPSLTRFAENVAYNYGYSNPSATAVSGWLKSPGHYANIMGDFNLTGVGVARSDRGEYYFTQIFVKAGVATLLQVNETSFLQADKSNKRLHQEACECISEESMLMEKDL